MKEDERIEKILEEHGFREIAEHEIIEDDYFKKPQSVILKNPQLWDWKWKNIGALTIKLPSGYLSWSNADVYVKAPENDEPKLVIAFWNRYETGIPKNEYYFVRKDLSYIIIVSEGTPEKIVVNGIWKGSSRGAIIVYGVKNGKIVYKNNLSWGPYDYYFGSVDFGKVEEFVRKALKVTR